MIKEYVILELTAPCDFCGQAAHGYVVSYEGSKLFKRMCFSCADKGPQR
jgi:ribosome-binding protein aMBF1 (putative translation factor)